MELLQEIFEVCIIPLLGVLVSYFIKWLNLKSQELIAKQKSEMGKKYLDMLNDTITACVIATTQTYVDSLKKSNAFDAEAQKKAFDMTLTAVKSLITKEAEQYLTEIIGDVNLYITQRIEAEVQNNK